MVLRIFSRQPFRAVASAFWVGAILTNGLAAAQPRSSGPARGTLIVDGGGATASILRRFVDLAGGANARIVVFPTGASSIRFGAENTILDPDSPRDSTEWKAYEAYLRKWFGCERATVLHTARPEDRRFGKLRATPARRHRSLPRAR
jgi:hypothetical protein